VPSCSRLMYKEKFRQKASGLPVLLNAVVPGTDDCTDGLDLADKLNELARISRLILLIVLIELIN